MRARPPLTVVASARRILAAIWDFLVGEDPRLALAALAAIGLTAPACACGLGGWWLAPVVALAALRWTLRGVRPSATRASKTSS